MCALLLVAASFGVCGAELTAPSSDTSIPLHKPAPTQESSLHLDERLVALVEDRYPGPLKTKTSGQAIVHVLFRRDGSVAHADYEVVPGNAEEQIDAKYYAQHFHMPANEIAYLGLQGIISPTTGQRVLITFTERRRPSQRYTPKLLSPPDTRAIDRALVERYFPNAMKGGQSDQERLWVLLDSRGNVVRTGRDYSGNSLLTRTLEATFSGIKTQFVTATPVTDDHSKPVPSCFRAARRYRWCGRRTIDRAIKVASELKSAARAKRARKSK